ncbi:hypothetical protein VitviT2T_013436 [Vitis vinifera]|uniref:Ovate family protein n=1 Tax=Vitis vinifera TaxID=29760 RepID=A0ABY9CKX1_VITVI|nr:uncharacterized protein LOC104880239 [Vitis vinifera]WJZ94595.1 hypothetical protein VitviT2T_013436 [Vitis vinifera]|eukprot:XP_010654662.1 PREDICTED: uncharacterized protein LOC104880239 [Vitis vinifera]
MQLRESIQKTKRFFHITLQNLKAFLFRGYQKLPETPPCNPFSCSSCKNQKKHQLDHIYADFSDQWESDQDRDKRRKMKGIMSSKELVKEEDNCSGNFVKLAKQSPENNKHEKGGNEEIKNMGSSHQGRRVQPSSYLVANGGGFALLQKMKELEMMDAGDVDHVLDIEEVLHHYSRLTCPIYLDIVDSFFMEMYREFFLPQAPSLRTNSSSRRLGPLKL